MMGESIGGDYYWDSIRGGRKERRAVCSVQHEDNVIQAE